MNRKIYAFFVLVFTFCGSLFADCETDKANCLVYIERSTNAVARIGKEANDVLYHANRLEDNYEGYMVEAYLLRDDAQQIQYSCNDLYSFLGSIRGIVQSVDCSSTNSAGMCPDLSPVLEMLSNIYSRLTTIQSDVSNISSTVIGGFDLLHTDLMGLSSYQGATYFALSNFNESVNYNFSVLSNSLASVINNQLLFNSSFQGLVNSFDSFVASYLTFRSSVLGYLDSINQYLRDYLPYLETINDSLAYLATNGVSSIDSSILSNFFSVAYWDESNIQNIPNFYMKSTKGVVTSNVEAQFPYNNEPYLDFFNLGTLVAGGFSDLMRATHSLNNYWYWFFTKIKTNELNTAGISEGLLSLSNIAARVDSYVLGDFSNKFNEVVSLMNVIVTNQLEQLTNSNISALSALVETNNIYTVSNNLYLSSIDSKLDVLDYIKILSDTPLSDYSGDGDYFGYLTNLYLNGSADSGIASTNWFERIEILLASLVFGDSGSSSISNEVEFTNFSEETLENAFNDYTFQNELTSGISLVEDTGENFLTILRGFHNSLSSISQPQSIAIGIGGLDGQDTLTYQDVMHHHFQVSFSSGASDNFTLIVRSMTTIIWILVTMMFVYFSARWLLSKVLFFYRLMRTLITSLFLK